MISFPSRSALYHMFIYGSLFFCFTELVNNLLENYLDFVIFVCGNQYASDSPVIHIKPTVNFCNVICNVCMTLQILRPIITFRDTWQGSNIRRGKPSFNFPWVKFGNNGWRGDLLKIHISSNLLHNSGEPSDFFGGKNWEFGPPPTLLVGPNSQLFFPKKIKAPF